MKNKIALIGIGILILVVAVFIFRASGNETLNGNIINKEDIQVVKLSVENGKYVLSPSEFKKGIPVRIEADVLNMPGCSKSIVIPSFDIRKSFTSQDNTLEFIPDKAGTFNIMCSMNMYQGTFVVLENDGSKVSYVEKSVSSGPSCGMSEGCGCGGIN
ncbi:MAG: cupredoxin domain-containing protein [Candidatus Pacearchaeota archaeon]|jgi:plastocyanin domain-containing protein